MVVIWVGPVWFGHRTASQLAISAANKSASAFPLIFLFVIVLVPATDSLNPMIAATKRFLENHLTKPLIESHRIEAKQGSRSVGKLGTFDVWNPKEGSNPLTSRRQDRRHPTK